MIVLSVMLKVKQGKEKVLEDGVTAMIRKVHLEKGTIAYTLHRHQNDPTRYMLYEKYKDKAAFDHHMATDYLQTLLRCFDETLEAEPVIEMFEEVASI